MTRFRPLNFTLFGLLAILLACLAIFGTECDAFHDILHKSALEVAP